MIGSGDASYIFGIVIMKVTFIYQHIDDRFVRVVEIPAMSPTLATMYLNEDLGQPFECFASGDEDRNLG